MGLKLNLGSGQNPRPGYVNVDKYGTPDLQCDLEVFPWPWADDAVSEIILHHVLEHLGHTPAVFIGIMKEMYRVCSPDAEIHITVPHPRHDHFIGDPTHVRAITPPLFSLFSKRENRNWQKLRAANSPLGLYHDVDFELAGVKYVLDEPYATDLREGRIAQADIRGLIRKYNNVASEIKITLKVIKDVGVTPE
jgi:hypothetical protein